MPKNGPYPIDSSDRQLTPDQVVSRRQLLKILTAAGGAVAASSQMPGQWEKPVVKVGQLPVKI